MGLVTSYKLIKIIKLARYRVTRYTDTKNTPHYSAHMNQALFIRDLIEQHE